MPLMLSYVSTSRIWIHLHRECEPHIYNTFADSLELHA